jgi:hypothetical protein
VRVRATHPALGVTRSLAGNRAFWDAVRLSMARRGAMPIRERAPLAVTVSCASPMGTSGVCQSCLQRSALGGQEAATALKLPACGMFATDALGYRHLCGA